MVTYEIKEQNDKLVSSNDKKLSAENEIDTKINTIEN